MGRRRKNTPTQRDATDIANDSELLREFIQKPKPYRPITHPPHLTTFKPLTLLEDNRAWQPTPKPHRTAKAVPRNAAALTVPRQIVRGGKTRSTIPSTVAFQKPSGVAVCVRRKVRREIMFALRQTRRGAAARRRRRNTWSDVKC